MPQRGQVVFHPCGNLGEDLTMNKPGSHQIIQPPTQRRCRDIQRPLQFIETNSLFLVEKVVEDVKYVGLTKEVNEMSSFGLEAYGCLLWLHTGTKSLSYISDVVSLKIPRFPQRNF